MEQADIVIVGAGAAGLMAGIWAGTARPDSKIIILDGAAKPGAKILVAGGGRCNVTHDHVEAEDFAGTSRNAIRKVLRRFDVPQTIAFFSEIGVELKREETGKLFPTSDSAKTVLNALFRAAQEGQTGAGARVAISYPRRVETITRNDHGFRLGGPWGELEAKRVILATGGKSLPKTGSDGNGYTLARSLGHTITERIFPGLVPLTLPHDHFLTTLSGLTVNARLDLRSSSGKNSGKNSKKTSVSFTDSTLCTHFGLSGPSVLNMSRYYTDAKFDDPGVKVTINWLPESTFEEIKSELQKASKISGLKAFAGRLPERLIRALWGYLSINPAAPLNSLTRDQHLALAHALTELPLPITGDRGFNYAEVTAGGVPLNEIRLEKMESRVCPGLHLCGEICDVDGRIGGFNFQWAWASGYVAGLSANAK